MPSGKFSRALHTSFVSLGSVSSMWKLETAPDAGDDARGDEARPLLYVLGGMQPRDNMLASLSDGSLRSQDAMLMEVSVDGDSSLTMLRLFVLCVFMDARVAALALVVQFQTLS